MTAPRPTHETCDEVRSAPRPYPPRRKDLLDVIADLPDPEEFAFALGEIELHALRTAYFGGDGWRVRVDYQTDCFRLGLCEARGPFLTAFGMAVRRVVMGSGQ